MKTLSSYLKRQGWHFYIVTFGDSAANLRPASLLRKSAVAVSNSWSWACPGVFEAFAIRTERMPLLGRLDLIAGAG